VEYFLTPLGESILPVLVQLNEWGTKNKDAVQQISDRQSVKEEMIGSSICQYNA
jgi:DNA-binding HxlR family transcriptional regulator